mmetsp:Transcript_52216/g.154121  ORF Transcript_52216/g.154121 Transcript_52216/m.154121 type:complete len:322 (-) Transcript_52216:481-1446(-)
MSCWCSLLTSCWQAVLSEPRRLRSGWQSVSAVKLLMISDCSVFAISSRTSSSPLFFDSCSRLHWPWSAVSSVTTDAAAVRKSDFMAVWAVRLRNAMKSLFRSRGRTQWRRRSESRTACTQETRTLDGGHRASMSLERCSQSSVMRVLTKSWSMPSSCGPAAAEPAAPETPSWSFWKPSTASQRCGTKSSVACAQAPRSATLSGRFSSSWSFDRAGASSPPAPAAAAASGGARASGAKQRSRDCWSTAALPMRYSLATFSWFSPRSSSVTELFTASSTERSGDLSLCSSALRILPICSSTSSRTFWKVGMFLYCRRKPAQLQ